MGLSLNPQKIAVAVGITRNFQASGGTLPYTYSVIPGGAGGLIDPNGFYGAPPIVSDDPSKSYDTVQVIDGVGAKATALVLVCTPLQLICDILQNEMGLADGRVYLWDQKIKMPTDFGMFIVVGELSPKPFSNNRSEDVNPITGVFESTQYTNFKSTLSIDVCSRGTSARDRKEEVLMALGSNYAQIQQESNSFKIGKVSTAFVNLSNPDGAAIPYRYQISVNIQYCVTKVRPVDYYDTFPALDITVDPFNEE